MGGWDIKMRHKPYTMSSLHEQHAGEPQLVELQFASGLRS